MFDQMVLFQFMFGILFHHYFFVDDCREDVINFWGILILMSYNVKGQHALHVEVEVGCKECNI